MTLLRGCFVVLLSACAAAQPSNPAFDTADIHAIPLAMRARGFSTGRSSPIVIDYVEPTPSDN
jgi:hypothetical protein